MDDLFGGKLAPITNTVGFLRCDHSRASQAFLDWQQGIQEKRGVSVFRDTIQGNFAAELERLLPLTSVERRRYLFIPTKSDWTAFFDNGHQGTDAFSVMSYLAKTLSCNAVRATYIPEGRKQYPAVMLEIYGPDPSYFLNYVRSVSTAFDGKKWTFATGGETLSFEQTEKYLNRSKKDRFTPEMLNAYLESLGISAYDETFYCHEGKEAFLVRKTGPLAPAAREFQLADLY